MYDILFFAIFEVNLEDKTALAVKNSQASLILFRSFVAIFEINLEDVAHSL